MPNVLHINAISDAEFDRLLREDWVQIALFAYQGYVKNCRGKVGME